MRRAAQACGQPFFGFVGACVEQALAYLRGDFAGAERWADIALRTGDLFGADDTEGSNGVQMFMIRRETADLKRFGGFVDGSETFAGRWVPGLLALYTELNCERGMTRALNQLLNRNLGDRTDEAQWPMELVFMVEAALELGNREAVHALRPFVARYAGKNLVAGQFVALFGSADRYLARIAALGGDIAAAERHFGAALEMDRRMGSVVHVSGDAGPASVVCGVTRSHRGSPAPGRRGPRHRRADRPDPGRRPGGFVADYGSPGARTV